MEKNKKNTNTKYYIIIILMGICLIVSSIQTIHYRTLATIYESRASETSEMYENEKEKITELENKISELTKENTQEQKQDENQDEITDEQKEEVKDNLINGIKDNLKGEITDEQINEILGNVGNMDKNTLANKYGIDENTMDEILKNAGNVVNQDNIGKIMEMIK